MSESLGINNDFTAANLSAVFFPPGEDAALTSAHDHFNVLAVHTLCLCSISYSIGIFEVDTMLVKELRSLLLIIWTTAKFKNCRESASGY
jgi:hypothetical protein